MLDVYMPRTPGASFDEALTRAVGPRVRLHLGPPRPAAYDVLVAGRPTPDDLDGSAALRWWVLPFAGVPREAIGAAAERPGIAVHNLHHNASMTAERAIGLLLAAAHRIVPADRALRRGDWGPRWSEDRGVLITGRRVLVVGYGAIGRRVADGLLGLGASVTAVRRRPGRTAERIETHGPEALDELLPTADILVLTLPSTEATRGLFDAERLGRLPQGALLVNVSRGDVIDERALFEALRDRRLGGAGLDVWYRYPDTEEARSDTPPSAFPFGELDHVVLSPHRAGLSEETEGERARHLARLLDAASEGRPVPGAVDLAAGY